MLHQLSAHTSRASVRFTVPGDGSHSEGPARPPGSSPAVPVDELAVRRQFEAMVAEHLPAMYARARELCRSHFDAEDTVQNAVLRAMRTAARLEDPERARAWLLRIVTTTFLDEVRKQRRRPPHDELVEDLATQGSDPPLPWDNLTLDDVRAAAGCLSEDVRDTYRMFALEGLDHTAIAEAQRVKKGTVGSRIYRARKELRGLLRELVERRRGGEAR